MTTKIEQVARAIDPETWARLDSGEISDDVNDCRFYSLTQARAAIQAMREPTAMMSTAFDEMGAWDDDTRLPTATEALNAMIDAALKEE